MDEKHRHELDWWVRVWAPRIRERGYWEDHHILELDADSTFGPALHPSTPGPYHTQRLREARARALRTPLLVGLPHDYLAGRIVVDIGSGPIGMLEMSGALEKYAVDPLASEYRARGLLLPGDHGVTYFSQGAETIPLKNDYVDVVVAFNSLDHVDDPVAVAREVTRILKPMGLVLINVELDHEPTPTEPHTMSHEDVVALFPGFGWQYARLLESGEGDQELTHGSRWLFARLQKPG